MIVNIDHGAGRDGGGPDGSAVDVVDGAAAPAVDPMSSSSSNRSIISKPPIESSTLSMLKSLETPLVDPGPLDAGILEVVIDGVGDLDLDAGLIMLRSHS